MKAVSFVALVIAGLVLATAIAFLAVGAIDVKGMPFENLLYQVAWPVWSALAIVLHPDNRVFLFVALGLGLLILLGYLSKRPALVVPPTRLVRGTPLLSTREAQRNAARRTIRGEGTILIAKVLHSVRSAPKVTVVVGVARSGKTTIMRITLTVGITDRMGEGSDIRLYIFDYKNTYYNELQMLLPKELINYVNPFARDGIPWNIAKDLELTSDANQLIELLFPEPKPGQTEQQFFRNSELAHLRVVLRAFMRRHPGAFEMRDVILGALGDPDDLAVILDWLGDDFEAARVRRAAFQTAHAELAEDIAQGLSARAKELYVVAARWHHQLKTRGRSFTINEWLSGSSALVWGWSSRAELSLRSIHDTFFTRVAQMIEAQGVSTTRETYIVLDELHAMGKVDAVLRLLKSGPAFGTRFFLGVHDLPSLEIGWGSKAAAKAVLGQTEWLIALHTKCTETQKWLEEVMGKRQLERFFMSWGQNESAGSSRGGSNSSQGSHVDVKSQLDTESTMFGSQFGDLPMPNIATNQGPRGVVRGEGGVFGFNYKMDTVRRWLPAPAEGQFTEEVSERGEDLDVLHPWTVGERERLGLPIPKSKNPKPSANGSEHPTNGSTKRRDPLKGLNLRR